MVCSAANGYEAGKTYDLVISAGTVDSVSVVGQKVGEFQVESVQSMASRLFAEAMWPTSPVVVTDTGNDVNRLNLTDFVDAQTTDDDLVNSQWLLRRATNDQVVQVVVTGFASARLAIIETVSQSQDIDVAIAAGDYVLHAGFNTVSKVTAFDTTELDQIVDDLLDAGRLDVLIDAIKAKTDELNFTGSFVQADVQAVDGAAISQGGSDPASPYGVT